MSALFAEGYTDAEDRDEPGVAYRREGDVKALVSVLRGSPLEALHIAPDQSIEGLSVDFDDFEEAYTAREYWNIYDKEDLETDAGAIKQLLAALPGLKRLVLPALYEADPGYQQVLADRGGLAVEFRSYIRLGWRGPFEADWEAHFEW